MTKAQQNNKKLIHLTTIKMKTEKIKIKDNNNTNSMIVRSVFPNI